MQIYSVLYGLLGLVVGSFLNVCICRIPLKKSVVFPGSSCPNCGSRIRFYDNVPVLSYLLLRGKCRSCGKPISMQYPLVELLSGLVFYCCARTWEFAPPTFVNTVFLSIVIILIFTDYHHRILPNVLTLPGTVAGILFSPFQTSEVFKEALSLKAAAFIGMQDAPVVLPRVDSTVYLWHWVASVLGALIGAGFLFLVEFVFEKIRHKEGLGMGDVKMMAMVGAFLGWRLAFLTIFAGSLIGPLIAIYLWLFRRVSFRASLQIKLAFGVYLGMGSALSLFYGIRILRWYFGLFPQ